MNTKQILVEARELLAQPNVWTKGAMSARQNPKYDPNDYWDNNLKEICTPTDPAACQFCSVGAVLRAAHSDNHHLPSREVRQAVIQLAGQRLDYDDSLAIVFQTNDDDGTELEDILELFDRAIAQAQE